jgi:hypothetical protein
VIALDSTQVDERATPPELTKGPSGDGACPTRDESLGQEAGAQGALIWPEQVRGCDQTKESPLRYGSETKCREAHTDVSGAARLKRDVSIKTGVRVGPKNRPT